MISKIDSYVIGFEKSCLPCKITNISFKVLHLGKENGCLYAICHDSIAIHSLSMHAPTIEWI